MQSLLSCVFIEFVVFKFRYRPYPVSFAPNRANKLSIIRPYQKSDQLYPVNLRFCFTECGSIVNNVECYDCRSGVWHELTPMIIPRKFVGSAILDDQLYAVGGINDQYGDLVTVEACNLSTNQWTSLASLQECKGDLLHFCTRLTPFSYPEPFLRAVNGARRGALAKSISNWHLIGYNEGYCSNNVYIFYHVFMVSGFGFGQSPSSHRA